MAFDGRVFLHGGVRVRVYVYVYRDSGKVSRGVYNERVFLYKFFVTCVYTYYMRV